MDSITKSLMSSTGSLSHGAFTMRLEKHIEDVKKGLGDLSKQVDYELSEKSSALSISLSSTNPKAASMFAGYSSLLRYDRAARFVNNLEYANRVQQNVQSENEVKQQIDQIVAYFNPQPSTVAPEVSSPQPNKFVSIQDEILSSNS